MNVTIRYCTICFGYRDCALAIGGKVGQFDIDIDGALVVSRGQSLLARMRPSLPPKSAEAVAAIERHLASSH